MLRDNFWLDGASAEAAGILLSKEITFEAPEPVAEEVKVPGRDGELVYYDGSYKNVRGEASCICLNNDVALQMSEINAFLLAASGYRRLQTRLEPQWYRLARIRHGAKFNPHRNQFNEFEVEFDCLAYKYYLSGEEPVHFTAAGTLVGPTPFPSLPRLVVHGSGQGTVTINGDTLTLTNCSEISLDCEEENASRAGENANSDVSGTFPRLGKTNTVSFGGGVTSITVYPRWRTI